ncbi:LexA family protein [Bifidobacterium psychraerophilum]|uniref:Peptidase S24 and S26 domain protein n=1 Tax=Bifidobacterium psychraerophilum TaxID=218140 RepID=A0A087CDF6_9BIFI|nr:S24 family peptidase [Bifidobacterium psychraerophilum]KFI81306.1 peptidase S24 and S26 domain protein [Bifidobacterium psychraerophilum]PKA95649.1 DNA polymerase V [Bifidobacterium psychraerophilum DSM 22366]
MFETSESRPIPRGSIPRGSIPHGSIFHALIQPTPVPLALESVRAGFPSVAQDYFAGDFSFDENVIIHPDTTFILKVAGDSMEGAGIFDEDLLVVDRSLEPQEGDVVVAILDDELTVKRLLMHGHVPILHAENARYPDFIPQDDQSLSIWGVVTGNYHSQRNTTMIHHGNTPSGHTPLPGVSSSSAAARTEAAPQTGASRDAKARVNSAYASSGWR